MSTSTNRQDSPWTAALSPEARETIKAVAGPHYRSLWKRVPAADVAIMAKNSTISAGGGNRYGAFAMGGEDYEVSVSLRFWVVDGDVHSAPKDLKVRRVVVKPLSSFEAAGLGRLPEGFDGWAEARRGGWSVAHHAAYHGNLPEGFNRWDIADAKGWTVAHVAARVGTLPAGFDRWTIKDGNGQMVAHIAAYCGNLPEGFAGWGLETDGGTTVARAAELGTAERAKSGKGRRKAA